MAIPRNSRLNKALNDGAFDAILAQTMPESSLASPIRPSTRPGPPLLHTNQARSEKKVPRRHPLAAKQRTEIYEPSTNSVNNDLIITHKSPTCVIIKKKW